RLVQVQPVVHEDGVGGEAHDDGAVVVVLRHRVGAGRRGQGEQQEQAGRSGRAGHHGSFRRLPTGPPARTTGPAAGGRPASSMRTTSATISGWRRTDGPPQRWTASG